MSIREGARFMIATEVTQSLADSPVANLANPHSEVNVLSALVAKSRGLEYSWSKPWDFFNPIAKLGCSARSAAKKWREG